MPEESGLREIVRDLSLDEEDVYGLCALYCDYAEWLAAPHGPTDRKTREEYEQRLKGIHSELKRRNLEDE